MYPKPILALLALASCTSVVPDTALRLGGFSPLTVDPADLRAAIDLPDGLVVPENGATLTFGAVRSDTGAVASETFVLNGMENSSKLVIFALDPASVETYRSIQSTVAAWEEDAPAETNGTFAIRLSACSVGAGPAEDARVSVFVATDPGGPLRPLIVNAPFSDIVSLSGGAIGGACP